MVKIVHPVDHELAITKAKLKRTEKELVRYKNENKQLQKELSMPRKYMMTNPGTTTSTRARTSTSNTKIIVQAQTTPRYAKATRASESKTVEAVRPMYEENKTSPKTKIIIQRSSPAWPGVDFTGSDLPEGFGYRDGILVKKVYGFLRPTRATMYKTKPAIRRTHARNEDDSTAVFEVEYKDESAPKTSGDSTDGDTWSSSAVQDHKEEWRSYPRSYNSTRTWLHDLNFNQAPHTMSDQAYEDIIKLHMLPLQTRLEDTCNNWLSGPLGHLVINDEFQFRLLLRARELAQKCFWTFLDANRPRVRSDYYPGGWQQVRFEGLQLSSWIGEFRSHVEVLRHRQNDPGLARSTVFNVVQLRHTTSHYHNWGTGVPSLRAVDAFIKDVQKLAIQFYDAERAAEARALRDELYEAAKDTLREVEALEPLVALPFAGYPWSYHHESMFADIRVTMQRERWADLDKLAEVVVRVAQDWDEKQYVRRREPPISSVDTEEDLHQNKKRIPARRHSISESRPSFRGCKEGAVLSRRSSTVVAEGRRVVGVERNINF